MQCLLNAVLQLNVDGIDPKNGFGHDTATAVRLSTMPDRHSQA